MAWLVRSQCLSHLKAGAGLYLIVVLLNFKDYYLIILYVFCLHAYLCTTCTPDAYGGQKKPSHHPPGTKVIGFSCTLPCSCLELNLGNQED